MTARTLPIGLSHSWPPVPRAPQRAPALPGRLARAMTARTRAIGLSLACAAVAFSAPAAQDARGNSPAIVDLGTLGHDYSVAVAVNDRRQVIGRLLDNSTPV